MYIDGSSAKKHAMDVSRSIVTSIEWQTQYFISKAMLVDRLRVIQLS